MKRFLTGAIIIGLLVFILSEAMYYFQFPVYIPEGDTEVLFRTSGQDYQRRKEDGSYETVTFRGVDVSSSLPGKPAAQFAPSAEDYLRWMAAIGDMGANLLRVLTPMDADFYNALYTYNTSHDKPLYLLQGISVSDEANYGTESAYSPGFLLELLNKGRDAIDIIHGRKTVFISEGGATGRYRRDISRWTIGYLVGADWNSATVAYTDHSTMYTKEYEGVYFSTAGESTAFEAMLAQVMDTLAAYETSSYNVQRPIAFINSPSCDFFEFTSFYTRQIGKYAYVDAAHVRPTERMQAGTFAAYRLYDFCHDYPRYLTPEMAAEYADAIARIPEGALYGGYLYLLAAHHTDMPLIVTGYGFSSQRNPLEKDALPLTEEEQGQAYVRIWAEAADAGWSGVCLSTWQDVWERRSWNSAYTTLLTKNYLWHDLQSDGQHYGLMAFEPGKEAVCRLDGMPDEWTAGDVVLKREDTTLSLRYDAQGIYLMAQGSRVSPEMTLYIPIDMTALTGSTACADPALIFSRPVDFLLCLNGAEDSRLLVQERYDAMRSTFEYETGGNDPYIDVPDADTEVFVPIRQAVANPYVMTPEDLLLAPSERRLLQALGTWETGKLVHGVGDPEAEGYNSLADFCYGENCVEVLLPWTLLNVGDPSDRLIHSDYYTQYGVDFHIVGRCYFGLTYPEDETPADMGSFTWSPWVTVSCRERLKGSYYVVQQAWRDLP